MALDAPPVTGLLSRCTVAAFESRSPMVGAWGGGGEAAYTFPSIARHSSGTSAAGAFDRPEWLPRALISARALTSAQARARLQVSRSSPGASGSYLRNDRRCRQAAPEPASRR